MYDSLQLCEQLFREIAFLACIGPHEKNPLNSDIKCIMIQVTVYSVSASH